MFWLRQNVYLWLWLSYTIFVFKRFTKNYEYLLICTYKRRVRQRSLQTRPQKLVSRSDRIAYIKFVYILVGYRKYFHAIHTSWSNVVRFFFCIYRDQQNLYRKPNCYDKSKINLELRVKYFFFLIKILTNICRLKS